MTTSKPTCSRCTANALGSKIDSHKDAELEIRTGGKTNLYHTLECGKFPQVPESLRAKFAAASVLRDMPVSENKARCASDVVRPDRADGRVYQQPGSTTLEDLLAAQAADEVKSIADAATVLLQAGDINRTEARKGGSEARQRMDGVCDAVCRLVGATTDAEIEAAVVGFDSRNGVIVLGPRELAALAAQLIAIGKAGV